jgi:hypothetical protein
MRTAITTGLVALILAGAPARAETPSERAVSFHGYKIEPEQRAIAVGIAMLHSNPQHPEDYKRAGKKIKKVLQDSDGRVEKDGYITSAELRRSAADHFLGDFLDPIKDGSQPIPLNENQYIAKDRLKYLMAAACMYGRAKNANDHGAIKRGFNRVMKRFEAGKIRKRHLRKAIVREYTRHYLEKDSE